MSTYTQQLRLSVGVWAEITAIATSVVSGVAKVTYTTRKTHSFTVGQTVTVQGLNTSGYNGTFTIDLVTSTTFRVSNATTGGTTVPPYGLAYIPTYYDLTTIDSLIINGGRPDITSDVSPMTSSVDVIIDRSAGAQPFNLNQLYLVEHYHLGAWVPLFTGTVTDIDVSVNTWASNTYGTFRYRIQAASMMAKMFYHYGYYTGSSIVTTSGHTVGDWVDLVINAQADDIDFYFAGTVGTDSTVMHKRSNGYYTDWDIASTAANTGRGNLHDRPNGKVYYSSFASSTSPSFYALTGDVLTATGLSARKSITDIYNKTSVSSTNQSINTATSTFSTSQLAYGYREGSRSTEAQLQTELDNQADDFNLIRRSPKWRFGTVTIDLANQYLEDADRTQLFSTRTNTAYLPTFPTQLGGATQCLTDNWSWSFSPGMSTLTLGLCPFTDLHP